MARKDSYMDFFKKVLEDLKKRRPGVAWKIIKYPPGYNWVAVLRVKDNTWYGIGFTGEGQLRVALHVSLSNKGNTHMLFENLKKRKDMIEKALGLEADSLKWESPANRGAEAGLIALYYGQPATINDTPERLQELQEWAVDMIIGLRTALTNHLDELLIRQSSAFGSGK